MKDALCKACEFICNNAAYVKRWFAKERAKLDLDAAQRVLDEGDFIDLEDLKKELGFDDIDSFELDGNGLRPIRK